MVIRNDEIIRALAILADNENMRATVQSSAKGAIACGSGAFIGGLLAGPIGIAVGGTVAALSAYKMTKGTFRSVGDVIRYDMTERQRQMLIEHVQAAVRDVDPRDLALLLPLIAGNAAIKAAIINTVGTFIQNELRMQISNVL